VSTIFAFMVALQVDKNLVAEAHKKQMADLKQANPVFITFCLVLKAFGTFILCH
jgi:hypothetical protein